MVKIQFYIISKWSNENWILMAKYIFTAKYKHCKYVKFKNLDVIKVIDVLHLICNKHSGSIQCY